MHRLGTLLFGQQFFVVVFFSDIAEYVVLVGNPAAEESEVILWQTVGLGILSPCDDVTVGHADACLIVQVDTYADDQVVYLHLDDAAVLQDGLVCI